MKLKINGAEVEVQNDVITQGIEKGEIEITTDFQLFKNEDLEALKKNLADQEYKKGKVAGEEILIKTGREKFGLEFEGKTLDNFAEAFKNKVLKEASIEPDKKVKELTGDLDKLRANLTEWETKYSTLQGSIDQERKQSKIENTLLSKLPKDKLAIPAEDVILVLKARNQFDLNEAGQIVIKANGEVMKNQNNLNPITLDEYLPNVLKPYIKETSGGGGGGDASKAAQGTLDAFLKEMEDKGIKQTSLAFQEDMQKRIKEGTLKIK